MKKPRSFTKLLPGPSLRRRFLDRRNVIPAQGVLKSFESVLLSVSLLLLGVIPGLTQSAAISYRGHLTAAGSPVNSPHDMQFKLFDTAAVGAGAQQGGTITESAVPVTNGVFTVTLDFGGTVFDGSPRFLEIGVKSGGSASVYTTLAPRQQVASIPYAIQSLNAAQAETAATATTLVTGAAVQSLNNLTDNVTLAAGSNVTITPSGNTLTIASTGGSGGGSGLWSLAGTDAYYNAGNVGIGTIAPTAGVRLEVHGATHLRPGNGNIQFGSPNSELGMSLLPTAGNRADLRFDGSTLKLVATAGVAPPSAVNGLAITTEGNVGIGTGSPAAGYRLEVDGATLLRPGNGMVQFGSPNSELGLTISPNVGNRADLRFDGSVLKLAATVGQAPPSAANGIAITTAGNVGVGTAAPVAKLHAETPAASTAAVYGNATGTGGIGVYGRSTSGTAVFAEGNAVQVRDKGGFVKAMAYIDPFLPANQYVVRCYNSQQAGSAVSTAPCGITVTRSSEGHYRINFGFNVEDRFVSLTAQASLDFARGVMVGMIASVSGSVVEVFFTRSRDDLGTTYDSRFHIVVY
ncbi:MAG: hypothetical protein IH623_25905 [Verrucomicrobia bacterium]|nr:hypothetical protein [Verrucomicrobiota bacterium]